MRQQKFVWAMLTAFALASCSTSQQLNSENGVLEGTMYSISNEPFTKLGIQTPDGTMYILKCTKEIEQSLNDNQGKKVKVHYENIEHSPEGLILNVTKFELESLN
jgi:hypothetical protein